MMINKWIDINDDTELKECESPQINCPIVFTSMYESLDKNFLMCNIAIPNGYLLNVIQTQVSLKCPMMGFKMTISKR